MGLLRARTFFSLRLGWSGQGWWRLPVRWGWLQRQDFLFPSSLGIPEGKAVSSFLGAPVGRLCHTHGKMASCGRDCSVSPPAGESSESSVGSFPSAWRSLPIGLCTLAPGLLRTGLGASSGQSPSPLQTRDPVSPSSARPGPALPPREATH